MDIVNLTRIKHLPANDVPLSIKRLEYEFRTDRWHRHLDFAELVVVISGSGSQETEHGKKLLKSGCVLLMPPGSVHRYANINNFIHYNILFGPELLNLPKNNLIALPGYRLLEKNSDLGGNCAWLSARDLAQLIGIIEAARLELQEHNPGWQVAAHLDFLRAILFICRQALPEEPHAQDNIFRIGNTMRIMQKNFRKSFSLTELAKLSGMSVSCFRHRFIEIVGLSPINYLIRLRLACAVNLLVTAASLDDIASEAGFAERNYMSRQFQRHIGMSPSEFRKKYIADSSILNRVLSILESSLKPI